MIVTYTFVPAAAYGLSPAQQVTFDQWYIQPGDTPAFDHLRLNKIPTVIHDVATDPRLPGGVISALGFDRAELEAELDADQAAEFTGASPVSPT